MLRPLFMLDQRDADTYYRQDEFALGDHLLICPVTQPESLGRWIYLTEGEWYNFWTNRLVKSVGEEVWVEYTQETFPFFIRAGAVLPMGKAMQDVGEQPQDLLELHIYYAEETESSMLYKDAGDGYEYLQGKANKVLFLTEGSQEEVKIKQKREGN